MLGIQDQGCVHRPHMRRAGRRAVQQMQEMTADAVIVRLHVDAAARPGEMIPVEQHRPQRGHQPVGNIARAIRIMRPIFRCDTAQHRSAHPQHIHGMGAGR